LSQKGSSKNARKQEKMIFPPDKPKYTLYCPRNRYHRPAIYYDFPNRDGLVTTLRVDTFTSSGDSHLQTFGKLSTFHQQAPKESIAWYQKYLA
jgi:hypothetical protein